MLMVHPGQYWDDLSLNHLHNLFGGKGTDAFSKCATQNAVAVGTTIADRPPHRSVRAELPHTAPTLDMWRQGAPWRTPLDPWDTRSPLGVGFVSGSASFSLVCALPSTTSAAATASLFGRFRSE